MFKKKPQIKNLSPLRSSDRRKLADQIIADYHIAIPTPLPEPQTNSVPAVDEEPSQPQQSQTQPTLTSIRSSLLPDSTSSARFTTTSGPNATPVSGTVYVGAYPGQDERILWFSYGKDARLIPTVYALWQNPGIVPLLHAADFVVEDKLKAGADLMTPGLVKAEGTKWDQRAEVGAVVAVAGITKHTVPAWIGTCEVDISNLSESVRGAKGAAVKGVQWEGDELWAWSTVGKGGRAAPDHIDGWQDTSTTLNDAVQNLDLEDEDEDEQGDGGVSLSRSTANIGEKGGHPAATSNSRGLDHQHNNGEEAAEGEGEEEKEQEPTTKEVDDAFYQAFLYSVYLAKKHNQPPHYGYDFPIQPSYLIANMVQPHLRNPNQHYHIKKTSWKNTKKFIKHLDKQVLVKSKDRNGGETVILDIDFTDQQIKDFQPYRLPKPKAKVDPANGEFANESVSASGKDPSLGQALQIQTVYRASAKLVPHLLDSKTTFYTSQQITAALKTYIESNPDLTSGVSNSRNLRLDPFIANNILGSNSSSSDLAALRAGEIDRGNLNRRILDDDHLCVPYHIILRNAQKFDSIESSVSSSSNSSSASLKPKPGPAPKVQITVEKRTGTKTVTKLTNLEPYFITPQLLAPELQKKCAGSASVGQLVGGKPGTMEIVVQGDQRDVLVKDVLAKRGVQTKWIDVVDKTKKGKK